MKIDKGDILEYRYYRYLIQTGYVVMRGLGVYTAEKLNQVTDIDLYGIKYNLDFCKDIIIIECKNRKKLNPLDRILWLKGLKEIIGAKTAILAIPQAKWDIKDYAYQVGVKIFDTTSLIKFESSFNLTENDYYGLADYSYYEPLYTSWEPVLSNNQVLSKALNFINIDSKNIPSFQGINKAFSELKWLLPKLSSPVKAEAHLAQWLLYKMAVCISIFILDLCEYLVLLDIPDRERYLKRFLTHGRIPQKMAEGLLNDSWKIAQRLSEDQFGKKISVPNEFYYFPLPSYFDGIYEVLERFCKNPSSAKESCNLLDFILFEYLFKDKEIDMDKINKVLGYRADIDIKQAKNIVNLIIKYADVPDIYFDRFLGL